MYGIDLMKEKYDILDISAHFKLQWKYILQHNIGTSLFIGVSSSIWQHNKLPAWLGWEILNYFLLYYNAAALILKTI